MTHPIPNLSTHAEQLAHYAAIKRRLYGGKPKPKPKPLLLEVVKTGAQPAICPSVSLVPLWKAHSIYFNDHVMRHRMRVLSTPADWLRDRCQELGYDYSEVVGCSRKRDAVKRRHHMIYEASERFTLSLPQLGRVFGGLDHTSILHAVRRHKERMNANDI